MKTVLLTLAAGVGLCAQTPQEIAAEAQRQSVEKMTAAVERQRESIRGQVKGAVAQAHPFFSAAWAFPAAVAAVETSMLCGPPAGGSLEPVITAASQRSGLAVDLLRAVIRKESAFQPCAVSPKGAMGLMQLMPATAAQFGVTDVFDPAENVRAGSTYLRELLDRYGGDATLALAAYNAGPARVDKAGGVPAIAETRNYVAEILNSLGTRDAP